MQTHQNEKGAAELETKNCVIGPIDKLLSLENEECNGKQIKKTETGDSRTVLEQQGKNGFYAIFSELHFELLLGQMNQ